MKKRVIRIISIALAIFSMTSVLFNESYAYSYNAGKSNTTISPTNAQFKSAKNPKKTSTSETINDSVGSAYDVDLFHYEAPKAGFYKIYTTGSTDTVGRIFEDNSFLCFKSYDACGYNDDSGEGNNFKIVTSLFKKEDYYIGVRAYGAGTGSYTLKIEPNDDMIYSKVGGTWTKSVNVGENDTIKKIYLNAEQVKHLYQLLRNQATIQAFNNYYDDYGPAYTYSKIVETGSSLFTVISDGAGLAEELGWLSKSIDSVTGGLISIGLSTLLNVMDYSGENINDIGIILGELQKYGGAGYTYNPNTGSDDYYATSGVCIDVVRSKHVIQYSGWVYYTLSYNYSSYNSTSLVGTLYQKGFWK